MKIAAEKRLFWFLKENSELDLENQVHLDMFIQQVLSRGKTEDVKKLLKIVNPKSFRESFRRIKRFLPKEVKVFWEEGLEYIEQSSKKNTHLI